MTAIDCGLERLRRLTRMAVVGAATVVVLSTTHLLAWERDIPGDGEARSVAVTQVGDIIAAGQLFSSDPLHPGGIGVVKFSGSTGATLWQRILPGDTRKLALDSRDNVVVAAFDFGRFTVIKLGGKNGTVRWRNRRRRGAPFAIATDSRGNVAVAGSLGSVEAYTPGAAWVVLKLSAIDGRERWHRIIRGGVGAQNTGFDTALSVAVDAVGDVVAGGFTVLVPGDSSILQMTIMKLAGRDGHQIWRRDIPAEAPGTSSLANAVRIDPAGDVIVAGSTGVTLQENAGVVVKLAKSSGEELWRRLIGSGGDIAVDRDGAVIVAGGLTQAGTSNIDLAAFKLSGDDGRELWRFSIDGTRHIEDLAEAVALDSAGNPVVAGFVQNLTTGPDLIALKLDAASGTEMSRWMIATGQADIAWAVATDSAGHAIVGGSTAHDIDSFFTVATFP